MTLQTFAHGSVILGALCVMIVLAWVAYDTPQTTQTTLYHHREGLSFTLSEEERWLTFDLYGDEFEPLYLNPQLVTQIRLNDTLREHHVRLEYLGYEVTPLLGLQGPAYRYRLTFEMPLTERSTAWHFHDALLELTLLGGRALMWPLGSVHVWFEDTDATLDIEALRPLPVNDPLHGVEAMYVRLTNPHNRPLCLEGVSLGDPQLQVTLLRTDDAFVGGQYLEEYHQAPIVCIPRHTTESLLVAWEDARMWHSFPLIFTFTVDHQRLRMLIPRYTYINQFDVPEGYPLEVRYGD